MVIWRWRIPQSNEKQDRKQRASYKRYQNPDQRTPVSAGCHARGKQNVKPDCEPKNENHKEEAQEPVHAGTLTFTPNYS